jgi:hypothetical protein
MWYVPYPRKVGDWFFPELLVYIYEKNVTNFVPNGESRSHNFLTARGPSVSAVTAAYFSDSLFSELTQVACLHPSVIAV